MPPLLDIVSFYGLSLHVSSMSASRIEPRTAQVSLSAVVGAILDHSGCIMCCLGSVDDANGRLPTGIILDRCALRQRITDYCNNLQEGVFFPLSVITVILLQLQATA